MAKLKKSPKLNLMTEAAYAREKGISRQRINKLVKDGKIPKTEGMIDPDKADKALKDNLDPAQSRKSNIKHLPEENGLNTFSHFRTVKEGYAAKLLELSYKEKAGILVNAKDVERSTFNMLRKIRDNMLGIPDRVTAQIISTFGVDVTIDNTNKARKILMDVIEKGLEA